MHDLGRLQPHLRTIQRQLAAVAWRVLRNAEEAEDAVQDTLYNVWAHRKKVLAHPNPPALILRMGFQCSIDRLRKRACLQPIPLSQASNAAPPPQQIIGRETRDFILHRIAALPAQQAEAIYLRVIEQMPYHDVAAALDCDESTARVHVRRARQKLRIELAHLLPAEVHHD